MKRLFRIESMHHKTLICLICYFEVQKKNPHYFMDFFVHTENFMGDLISNHCDTRTSSDGEDSSLKQSTVRSTDNLR